tara:strand:- start:16 stop:222 length:207 start_codon:yes stop_codon:yes gene_type:complete
MGRKKDKNYITKAEQTKELNRLKKLKRQEESVKPYTCDCGSVLKNKKGLSTHKKTWTHTNYLHTIGEL